MLGYISICLHNFSLYRILDFTAVENDVLIDITDFIRCKQWVIRSRRADLDDIFKRDGPEHLNKSYVVCSDHFVQKDFRNKNLLSQG